MFEPRKEAEEAVCKWMSDDIPNMSIERIEVVNKDQFLELIKLFESSLTHAFNAGIEAAEKECEKAFEECDTLNLLHGAARIRALKLPAQPKEMGA